MTATDATPGGEVRRAHDAAGFAEAAELLVAFNTEYGDPAPPAEELGAHLARICGEDASVLLVGSPAAGVAVLRFRTQSWQPELEAYLAEFYVVPERRGEGIGTRFLDSVIEHARARGATYLDLNTSEDDEAARRVYERRGFDNHEGRGHGPRALYYELEL